MFGHAAQVTPFLFGGKGIPLIFDAFLLYRGLNDLEESHFQRRTAEMGVFGLLAASESQADTPILQPGRSC